MYLAFCPSGASSVVAQATTNVTKFGLIEIRACRRRALMHSIAMSSLSAFLTISSFIASPTPCCPFRILLLTPLQSPLKKTQYPDATFSEVLSLFVSYSPMASQPFAAQGLSRVSMWPIPLTPLTAAAVRTLNVPSVSSFSWDLAPAALCFMRAAFFSAASPVTFSKQMPPAIRPVPFPGVFYPGSCLRFSDVLGAALPPRLNFSIADTFAYSLVPSEHSTSPHFGPHVFRGGGVPTLLPQARLSRETTSLCCGASPPVDDVGRLALSASTSSRINRYHEETLVHARTL